MIKQLMTRYVPGMLTCQEVDRFLYDFHQGVLPFGQRLKFNMHIVMCRECQAYLAGYQNTIRLTKGVVEIDNELVETSIDKVPEELINAILQVRQSIDSSKNSKTEYKD